MGQDLKKALRERRKEITKKKGGRIPYFTIKEGIQRMRILPTKGEQEFAVEAIFFWLGEKVGGVVSPATFGEPCAMMEAYEKLKNSKDPDDKEASKKIIPKKRFFIMHYKYHDEKGKNIDFESGAKLAIITSQLYGDILDLYLDEEEQGDMTDPDKGYDLKYKRTGTGQYDTEYSVTPCKPTPINKKFRGKTYDPARELKKIIPTYEKTVELVEEIFGSDFNKEKPRKKKKSLKAKKKIRS